MLLRLRGEEQFSRPLGRHLYATLLSAMVWAPGKTLSMLSADLFQHWKPLFASEEPSQEYLMLESQLPKATSRVSQASLTLRTFFHGVSKLRSRIKNFLSLKEDAAVEKARVIESYLKAAARLEERVSGWCTDLSWTPRKIPVGSPHRNIERTPWTSGTLFRLYCFGSWEAFFHWNRFFVSKICLHAAILDVLSTLRGSESAFGGAHMPDDLYTSHTAVLQETVRDFIGTLAYALGDVDEEGRQRGISTGFIGNGMSTEQRGIDVPSTLQVQAPLSYLITLKHLGPGQREAMFLALQRIQGEFRIR